MNRLVLIISAAVIILGFSATPVFSQQETTEEAGQGISAEEWLLGDVIALDLKNNQLTIGYIDFETYEEKEIDITVDSDTIFENVASLDYIKVDDAVAIDYIIDHKGQAIALNIRVE